MKRWERIAVLVIFTIVMAIIADWLHWITATQQWGAYIGFLLLILFVAAAIDKARY